MMSELQQLPVRLDGNLIMRWATADDTEALAAFNARIHSDTGEPDEAMAAWTRDLMGGHHPTASPSDFTVIVDEANGGRIVSSLMLISQTWTYAGLPFGVGRPELVGTEPEYRQRGLVRRQMDVIHALSALRGELAQAITGVPWFYRQFGYEQTVTLGGSRLLVWGLRGELKDQEAVLRPARREDIPSLETLYARHTAPYLLACRRDANLWSYLLEHSSPNSVNHRFYQMVESPEGALLGYIGYYRSGERLGLTELAAVEGVSLRDFCVGVAAALRDLVSEGETAEAVPAALRFSLGVAHPAYDVLGGLLERQDPPYAWYLRVPDTAAFLRHIGPVLEERLAASILAGISIDLKLNFYKSHLQVVFERGKLVDVTPYVPADLTDGHASFPDHTFLHVLFGHRTIDDLANVRADCYMGYTSRKPLLETLFPVLPSTISPLS